MTETGERVQKLEKEGQTLHARRQKGRDPKGRGHERNGVGPGRFSGPPRSRRVTS